MSYKLQFWGVVRTLMEGISLYSIYDLTSSRINGSGIEKYQETKKFLIEIDQLTDQIDLIRNQLVKDLLTPHQERKEQIKSRSIEEFYSKLGIDRKYLLSSQQETPHPSTYFDQFECFTPTEIQKFLNFGPSIPSFDSSHPLLSLLTLQARCEQKSDMLEERGIQNIDTVSHETKMVYANQFSPQEAIEEVQKESIMRIGCIAAYFTLIHAVGKSDFPHEDQRSIPTLRPISGEKVTFTNWKPFLLSSIKRRFGALLLITPVALFSIQFIDPWIKKLNISESIRLNDFKDILMRSEHQIAAIPPETPEYTRKAMEKEIKMNKETKLLELKLQLSSQAKRPSMWLGGTIDDPYTKERALITLFYRPLADIIIFYGIFLKSLLHYMHPIAAHLVTAFMYAYCRETRYSKWNNDPDILTVLPNLSNLEGGISRFIRSLLQQSLYHISSGSIIITYFLGLLHRGFYYFTQEVFSSVTVTPIELSPFTVKIIRVQSQLYSLISYVSLTSNNERGSILRQSMMKFLPKTVLDDLPNANKIVSTFSSDLILEYQNRKEEEGEKRDFLTIDEVCSCLLRLDHYKRQKMPSSSSSMPLFLIDESVIKNLLLVTSPLFIEGRLSTMLDSSPSLSHMIEAELLAIRHPTAHTNNNSEQQQLPRQPLPHPLITNRLSYLSFVQSSFARYELSEFFSLLLLKKDVLSKIPSFDSKSLYSIQMKGVSSVMRLCYLSVLQDLYPSGKVSPSEFHQLIQKYFTTMESKIMMKELKKIEEARMNCINEDNLHSYMIHYSYDPLSSSSNNNKEEDQTKRKKRQEELIKIIQSIYSSIKMADEVFFEVMEPLLFQEFQSSLIGRPVDFLQSSSHPSDVAKTMHGKKEVFVNRLQQYQSIVRTRYIESVLMSEYGLTSAQFKHLINEYTAHNNEEIVKVLATWEYNSAGTPFSLDKKICHEDMMNKLLMKDKTRQIVYDDKDNGGNTLKKLTSLKRN